MKSVVVVLIIHPFWENAQCDWAHAPRHAHHDTNMKNSENALRFHLNKYLMWNESFRVFVFVPMNAQRNETNLEQFRQIQLNSIDIFRYESYTIFFLRPHKKSENKLNGVCFVVFVFYDSQLLPSLTNNTPFVIGVSRAVALKRLELHNGTSFARCIRVDVVADNCNSTNCSSSGTDDTNSSSQWKWIAERITNGNCMHVDRPPPTTKYSINKQVIIVEARAHARWRNVWHESTLLTTTWAPGNLIIFRHVRKIGHRASCTLGFNEARLATRKSTLCMSMTDAHWNSWTMYDEKRKTDNNGEIIIE